MSLNKLLQQYKKVVFITFEFTEQKGSLPSVKETLIKEFDNNLNEFISSGHNLSAFLNSGDQVLFISCDFGHSMRCLLSLGHLLPKAYIDLALEAKNTFNGLEDYEDNTINQTLISAFKVVTTKKNLPYALKRGHYLRASALIERNGIPFDTTCLLNILDHKDKFKSKLIEKHDEHGIYVDGAFSKKRFSDFLCKNDINWPLDSESNLILKKEVFEERAQSHRILQSLSDLRKLTSKLSKFNLPIGNDERSRCHLNPFSSKTWRNQPSNADFIFGQPSWLRGLIKPPEGFGIAYIDYSQQEFGIAAALSGDMKMKSAYQSGDPYLAFAIQAGAAPHDATKQSHTDIREQFKACTLAVQYGMSAASFAKVINQGLVAAEKLIALHKSTYHTFWAWSDAIVNYAMTHNKLQSVYDCRINFNSLPNPRLLRNYPMQANGSEMLRLACTNMLDNGIKVCAPVHDAVLIEAPLGELNKSIRKAQKIMAVASSTILNGFTLNTDVDTIKFPERFEDPRGTAVWNLFHKSHPGNI